MLTEQGDENFQVTNNNKDLLSFADMHDSLKQSRSNLMRTMS